MLYNSPEEIKKRKEGLEIHKQWIIESFTSVGNSIPNLDIPNFPNSDIMPEEAYDQFRQLVIESKKGGHPDYSNLMKRHPTFENIEYQENWKITGIIISAITDGNHLLHNRSYARFKNVNYSFDLPRKLNDLIYTNVPIPFIIAIEGGLFNTYSHQVRVDNRTVWDKYNAKSMEWKCISFAIQQHQRIQHLENQLTELQSAYEVRFLRMEEEMFNLKKYKKPSSGGSEKQATDLIDLSFGNPFDNF